MKVCKKADKEKIKKFLSVDEIAEVLEEDVELIWVIAYTIENNPQKSDGEIYRLIHRGKGKIV